MDKHALRQLFDMKNRVVTGGTSGIGLALAEGYVAAGGSVDLRPGVGLEGSPSPSQCSQASDHEALLRSAWAPTFVGRRPLVGQAIQVSESIHRSRRRPSRAMSSGSRSVLVSNEIP